jgi:hypothetical protein
LLHAWQITFGSVHLAYNPFFSAFLAGTVFFSHNKSANSIFQPAYQHSRTGPKITKASDDVLTHLFYRMN